MILYKPTGIHHLLNLFRFNGSVFPRVLLPSLVCGTCAGLLRYVIEQTNFVADLDEETFIMKDTIVWQGFSTLVGFLIVFRTSMAYNRFWEGCTHLFRMRAEWMDAASSIFAFLKYPAQDDGETVEKFKSLLIRLFSMLHALALAEIEDTNSRMPEDVIAFGFNLIDPEGIDDDSLCAIRVSDGKAELVFQWIQQLVTENIRNPASNKSGALQVPTPILSRAYQELANGMVCFQEALKVSSVPFPFPYAQCCDCLLTIHWLVTPLVVCQWFTSPLWAGLFTTICVFFLWVLNLIAVEIENPFGTDPNDIDCYSLHEQMNNFLVQLSSASQGRTPSLQQDAELGVRVGRTRSFFQVWGELKTNQANGMAVTRSCRRASISSMRSNNSYVHRHHSAAGSSVGMAPAGSSITKHLSTASSIGYVNSSASQAGYVTSSASHVSQIPSSRGKDPGVVKNESSVSQVASQPSAPIERPDVATIGRVEHPPHPSRLSYARLSHYGEVAPQGSLPVSCLGSLPRRITEEQLWSKSEADGLEDAEQDPRREEGTQPRSGQAREESIPPGSGASGSADRPGSDLADDASVNQASAEGWGVHSQGTKVGRV